MPTAVPLEKARLVEMLPDLSDTLPGGRSVIVQFNPDSLKLSYANQVQQPQGGSDSSAPPAIQFVGAGSTKLAVQLWFDVSAPLAENARPDGSAPDDVRKLTERVAWFITPKPSQGQPNRFVPPALAFLWGTFQFNGIVESLEESLEFFSPDGRPLRASVSLNLSQPRIDAFKFASPQGRPDAAPRSPLPGGPGNAAGTTGGAAGPASQRLASPPPGASLQAYAQAQGLDWKAVAEANDIDNPRRLDGASLRLPI